MAGSESDLAAAQAAALALSAAVDSLSRTHPNTLDLRRLAEDVRRIRADLTLIAGVEEMTYAGAGRHDTEYDPRQFGDGAYEDVRPRQG